LDEIGPHITTFESTAIEYEKCLAARAKHVRWLETALGQMVRSYVMEWDAQEKQDFKEAQRRITLVRQRAAADKVVDECRRARGERELGVATRRTELEAERTVKGEAMQRKEVVREGRLAHEREQSLAAIASRALARDAHHSEVCAETRRQEEELRETRAAKAHAEDSKASARKNEQQCIHAERSALNFETQCGLDAMVREIREQKLRSVCDPAALERKTATIVKSVLEMFQAM